jgi:hypothetical protein
MRERMSRGLDEDELPIPVNCPQCGRAMLPLPSGQSEVALFRCAVHGEFHFGRRIDLTPGAPNETAN